MNEEIAALREEIAKLRERVAVLEATAVKMQPSTAPPSLVPLVPPIPLPQPWAPYKVTC